MASLNTSPRAFSTEVDSQSAYLSCTQSETEPVSQYSSRFLLATQQMGYSFSNQNVIHRYIDGLTFDIQISLMKWKRSLRVRHPSYIFKSLDDVVPYAQGFEDLLKNSATSSDIYQAATLHIFS